MRFAAWTALIDSRKRSYKRKPGFSKSHPETRRSTGTMLLNNISAIQYRYIFRNNTGTRPVSCRFFQVSLFRFNDLRSPHLVISQKVRLGHSKEFNRWKIYHWILRVCSEWPIDLFPNLRGFIRPVEFGRLEKWNWKWIFLSSLSTIIQKR